jgi:hypothetical protein
MRTSKLPLGLLVAAVAFAGVVGLFFSHTFAQQTKVVHLAQGWNLVTWTGETQAASVALAPLGDTVPVVYGYHNDSQIFTRHIVGRPEVSTLTDFGPEEAYWVLALRSAEWSVPGQAQPSCPTATPCPISTPCPSCDDWQSLAVQCAEDYGQCVDDYGSCVADYGQCVDSFTCWTDCLFENADCWTDCNFDLGLCVLGAPSLSAAKACVAIWDCTYCDDIWDCTYCD